MPNHFHLLVLVNEKASMLSKNVKPRKKYVDSEYSLRPEEKDFQENLSQAIGTMLSSYTRAINKRFNRTGALFRKGTKVKNGWIDGAITVDGPNRHLFFKSDNDYARKCFYYIHQNPVKARLVTKEVDWIYSSARDYAGLRNGTLCNQDLAKTVLELP